MGYFSFNGAFAWVYPPVFLLRQNKCFQAKGCITVALVVEPHSLQSEALGWSRIGTSQHVIMLSARSTPVLHAFRDFEMLPQEEATEEIQDVKSWAGKWTGFHGHKALPSPSLWISEDPQPCAQVSSLCSSKDGQGMSKARLSGGLTIDQWFQEPLSLS